VANGTSTTSLIERAGIEGRCSIWADPLHDGPVPGGLDDDGLLAARAAHIAGRRLSPDEVAGELRRWRSVIDEDRAYRELVLWFEHDLFDQLNLVQLLDWIASRPRLAGRVSLICVGSFPGKPDFKGLGELTPPDIAALFETRAPV